MRSLLLVSMLSLSLIANTIEGQRYYKNYCSSCHGNGEKGARMATQEEWTQWFNSNKLIDKHKNSVSLSQLTQSKQQSLLDFLYMYASDSGNTPTCSGIE